MKRGILVVGIFVSGCASTYGHRFRLDLDPGVKVVEPDLMAKVGEMASRDSTKPASYESGCETREKGNPPADPSGFKCHQRFVFELPKATRRVVLQMGVNEKDETVLHVVNE